MSNVEIASQNGDCPTIPAPSQDAFFPARAARNRQEHLAARRFPDAAWVDLLEAAAFRAISSRPESIDEIAAAVSPGSDLIIDEIQKVPALLDPIHRIMETPGTPRFILSGSSARSLGRPGVNLLAGRAIMRTMHPFLAAELGDRFDLDEALSYGLIPAVWSNRSLGMEALESYAATYVRDEVAKEAMTRDLPAFERFLQAISFSHGGVLNVSKVAQECEVGRRTVEGFLKILEEMFLGFRLPVFARRVRRKVTAHPKFFFVDAGLFRTFRPGGALDSPEEARGAALEGLFAQHLRAWADYSGNFARLHFWRTRGGSEVDFVLYGEDVFWALEVKHATRIHNKDLRGLRAFAEDYPEAECRLAYSGKDRLRIGNVTCLPADDLLRNIVPGRPLP